MVKRSPLSRRGAVTRPIAEGANPAEAGPVASRPVSKSSSRVGKRVLSVFITPEAWKQLRALAIEEETTTQALGTEAVNMLFAARQKNRVA